MQQIIARESEAAVLGSEQKRVPFLVSGRGQRVFLLFSWLVCLFKI